MSLHRWTGLFIVGFSSVTQNGAVLAELRIGGVVIARNNQTVHNNLTSNGDDIVREEIFYGMTDTNERFEFTNLDHAGAHCSVRMAIIDAINGMKAGGTIDYDMGSPPFVFPANLKADPSPTKLFRFRADTGVTAATAVESIKGGITRAECLTARHSAILIGHHDILGAEFINGLAEPGMLVIDGNGSSLMKESRDPAVILPGDPLAMVNKADYVFKTVEKARADGRRGMVYTTLTAENCIYVGWSKYSGLGDGFQDISENQMRQKLAEGYATDTGITLSNAVARSSIRFQDAYKRRIKIHTP